MKTRHNRAALAIAAAAGLILGAPAIANAAVTVGEPGSAANARASERNELCGTAYIGAYKLRVPPPEARAIGGLTVTMSLIDNTGTVLDASEYTTDANGVFCAAGDDANQDVLRAGGRSRISIDESQIAAYNATVDEADRIAFSQVFGGPQGFTFQESLEIASLVGMNLSGANIAFHFEQEGAIDPIDNRFDGGSLGTGSYIGVLSGLLSAVEAGSMGLNDILTGSLGSADS